MSKTTLRKRLAVITASALTFGVLSVVTAPVANATHQVANSTSNTNAESVSTCSGVPCAALFVATKSNVNATASAATFTAADPTAASKGVLAKDTSSGTAQTVTMLAGGILSLYANVSTAITFSASGGSFSSVQQIATSAAGAAINVRNYFATYNSTNTKAWLGFWNGPTSTLLGTGTAGTNGSSVATGVAALWTAPTTTGTYTVSLLTGFTLGSSGSYSVPNSSNGDSPTLAGNITVSVVASSSGGSYSAAYSACRTSTSATTSYNALVTSNAAVDSTGTVKNGDAWSIEFDLNDAYAADLDPGNIVATATNGALLSIGAIASGTPVAGTASTVVSYAAPSSRVVRIDQPTAGAPVTTTVTITYNGTTVCSKTVTIRGKVAKIAVANVGTQDLNVPTGSAQWMYEQIGLYSAGMFTVLATDSAGNIVATDGLGTFSADAATLTTVVQAATFPTLSTSTSSTAAARFTLGSFQCGAVAGSANIKVKFTTTSTGEAITSDAFTARCADNPDTYTVSLDKASYKQGDIATATVQFLDNKGNKANSVTAVGANSWVLPYFSPVTFTGTLAQGASATAVTKADGSVTYTFTVGTSTAVENGSYAGVVTYDVPANGTKQTVQYTLSRGGDTTTNADVLKSIVALIASINKQIQALQKLILQRR